MGKGQQGGLVCEGIIEAYIEKHMLQPKQHIFLKTPVQAH